MRTRSIVDVEVISESSTTSLETTSTMKPQHILFLFIASAIACGAWAEPPETRLANWQADIRFLAQELPKRHKHFYAHLDASAFQDSIAALEKSLPNLTDEQVTVQLARIVASARDAHTQINIRPLFRTIYPIGLMWFKDGYYVVRTLPEYQAILGTKWIGIGNHAAENVESTLKELIAHENEQWVREMMPNYLIAAPILQAVHLIDPSNPTHYRFQKPDGTTIDQVVTATETAKIPQWAELLDAKSNKVPLRYLDRNKNYWHQWLPEAKAMYVCYRRCSSMAKPTINEWAKEMLADLDEHKPDKLIIDLRDNAGGNSALFAPILFGIGQRDWINQKGKLYVLIGRRTFSSGLLNALELKRTTQSILVGEPTGQKPNAYGEVKQFALPHSKIEIFYSTKYFRMMKDDPDSLEPDEFMETTVQDYRDGRDPILEKLLKRT